MRVLDFEAERQKQAEEDSEDQITPFEFLVDVLDEMGLTEDMGARFYLTVESEQGTQFLTNHYEPADITHALQKTVQKLLLTEVFEEAVDGD